MAAVMGSSGTIIASALLTLLLCMAGCEARTEPLSHEHRRRMAAHPEGGRHRVKAFMAVMVGSCPAQATHQKIMAIGCHQHLCLSRGRDIS